MHRPEVDKLPLDERCTELGYDVTRPQPQLFVARDFEHLHDVLESVSQTLACERGGAKALSAAVLSGELSTVYLSDGMQVIGTLDSHYGGTDKGYLVYTQGAALAHRDRMLLRRNGPTLVPLGTLADGTNPRGLDATALTKRAGSSGRVTLRYASGLSVVGTPCAPPWPEQPGLLALRDVAIVHGQRALLHCKEPYPLLLAPELITACAGSASPQCSPLAVEAGTEGAAATQDKAARPRVPRQRELSPSDSALNALYDRTLSAPRVERASASPSSAALETIRAEAGRSHPDEWLLYWNLLERFDPCARHNKLASRLQSHLLKLEEHYGGRHPITTGLDYLTRRI
jgi:phenylalanine-4-hydroxylase